MFDTPTRTCSTDPATDWNRFVAAQPSSHELAMEREEREQKALCDSDEFSNWLCEGSGRMAFGGPAHREFYVASAVRVIQDDPEAAIDINTPDLLALALGITPFPAVRIAAMDELRRRYLEDTK